ncbi:MAG: hypothetical protein GY804_15505, partial [Alphaproteobacteria bacterium]|nr:hypothetical protein [Alphaproteobacteria bacterium]
MKIIDSVFIIYNISMQDIQRSAFRQPAPSLIMGVDRKAFKSGKEGAVNKKNPLTLKETRKATATYRTPNYRTTSFVTPDPIGRSPMSFERALQIEAQEQGIKVQLGPKTLSNMLQVKVPDPQNPAITIQKNMPLAILMQSNEGRLAAIDALIKELQAVQFRETEDNRDKMLLLGQMLGVMNENIKNLSKDQREHLIEATHMTVEQKLDAKYQAMGLPARFISIDNITADNKETIWEWFTNEAALEIHSGLDDEDPVYGIDGDYVSLGSIEDKFKAGQVLDLETRTFYPSMESLPRPTVTITEVISPRSPRKARRKLLAIRSPSAAVSPFEEEKEEKKDPDAGLS